MAPSAPSSRAASSVALRSSSSTAADSRDGVSPGASDAAAGEPSGPADGTVTGARAGGPRPRESTRAVRGGRTSCVPAADRRMTRAAPSGVHAAAPAIVGAWQGPVSASPWLGRRHIEGTPATPPAGPATSAGPRVHAQATSHSHRRIHPVSQSRTAGITPAAVGYVVAAVAMVIPLGLAIRFRWVVRLGLMGYAATTILGWAIQGPYYSTAFIAKGIEVALIVLVAIDFARMDGNPVTLVRRELSAFMALVSRRSGSAGAPP